MSDRIPHLQQRVAELEEYATELETHISELENREGRQQDRIAELTASAVGLRDELADFMDQGPGSACDQLRRHDRMEIIAERLAERGEKNRKNSHRLALRADVAAARTAELRRSTMVCLDGGGAREADTPTSNITERHLRIA